MEYGRLLDADGSSFITVDGEGFYAEHKQTVTNRIDNDIINWSAFELFVGIF